MKKLLVTYLVGEHRKYELYGDEGIENYVTKVLEYAYVTLDPENKFSQWACKGPVDIDEYIKGRNNPSQMYSPERKINDISSIQQLCKNLAYS